MRLTSALWVSAYIRRCAVAGAPAVIARRGASEAGAVHIRIDRLDGTVILFSPAPQALFDDDRPQGRLWLPRNGGSALDAAEAETVLTKETRFDPDIWVVDVEDRDGRNYLLPDEVADQGADGR